MSWKNTVQFIKLYVYSKRKNMSPIKKWNILFIAEDHSMMDSNTPVFDQVFNKVDKASTNEEAIQYLASNQYDIIISDISVEVMEGIIFLKEIKEKKPKQSIFALVSPKDSDKLYLIADLGMNAFELSPEDFDLALEEIGKFDPYTQELE